MLAHQGGWDETLIVLSPLFFIAALLWVGARRAKRLADAAKPDQDPASDD